MQRPKRKSISLARKQVCATLWNTRSRLAETTPERGPIITHKGQNCQVGYWMREEKERKEEKYWNITDFWQLSLCRAAEILQRLFTRGPQILAHKMSKGRVSSRETTYFIFEIPKKLNDSSGTDIRAEGFLGSVVMISHRSAGMLSQSGYAVGKERPPAITTQSLPFLTTSQSQSNSLAEGIQLLFQTKERICWGIQTTWMN